MTDVLASGYVLESGALLQTYSNAFSDASVHPHGHQYVAAHVHVHVFHRWKVNGSRL